MLLSVNLSTLESLKGFTLSLNDINFVIEIEKDVAAFGQNPGNQRVLVFPPVSNYRRFLIHKLIEESYPQLKTFSIGEGEERRTVLCFKNNFKDSASPSAPEPSTPAKRARTIPSVGIYKPPAARKLEENAASCACRPTKMSHECKNVERAVINGLDKPRKIVKQDVEMPNPQTHLKPDDKRNRQRRPDMQVYVPRGQRIAEEHHRKLEEMALNRDCEGIELDLGRSSFEESDGSDNEKYKATISRTTASVTEEATQLKSETNDVDVCGNSCEITIIDLDSTSNESGEEGLLIPDDAEEKSLVPEHFTLKEVDEKNGFRRSSDPCSVLKENIVGITDMRQKESLRVKTEDASKLDKKPIEMKRSVEEKLNPAECDWESLFDDSGECLEPSLLSEITKSVQEVVIETPKSNYDDFKYRNLSEEFPHVVEVYNFPPEFKTQDLVMVFSEFKHVGFEIKWVDDTHALGIFSNAAIVSEVLCMKHPFVKTRCLSEGSQQSKSKARRISDSLTPYTARPDTCAALARRLVTGALGVRLPTQRAEREAEKKLLSEAREKKKLAARQREQAWEGTLS